MMIMYISLCLVLASAKSSLSLLLLTLASHLPTATYALSPSLSPSPSPSSSPSSIPITTALTPRSGAKCPHTHYPTLSQYRLAYTTYCDRHFTPNRWLMPDAKVDYTYVLADGRGYPIKWVLSVLWDQGGFLSGGKMLVERERCYEWFQEGIGDNDEWVCAAEKGGEVLVRGGKRNVFEDGVKGFKVWVETRKRVDDGFEPPPE